MTDTIRIPTALHDVFGRTQTRIELGLVLLAAVGLTTAVCIADAATLAAVAAWRAAFAVLLVLDIAAGCVANFTRGTDAHYAERPTRRWLFILVHWHLVAVGLLLGAAVTPLLVITAYTLVAASAVNLLHGSGLQVPVGGLLTAAGIVGIVLWGPLRLPPLIVATAALFVLKVVFAFAVTHHPAPSAQHAEPSER